LIVVDYPDDSLFATAASCTLALTEATTEGPCYFGVSQTEDISSGRNGLPMMLCLQLVDRSCNPLEGYLIEVWHCDRAGVYSGDTSDSDDVSTFAGSFCTGGDSAAEASTWFRGELTTDSSGRINLKSCFPGWYRGRTIHIHFRVRLEYGGSDYVVSQFCFDDAFAEEICTTHEMYIDRGVQDTPLSSGSDTVFPATGYNDYLLNTEQNADGTLLAYKRIMIDV
jgi:protocatechuate 3,4-dioxygenase beta subunit